MNTCRRVHFIVFIQAGYFLIQAGCKQDVDFGHYHFPLSLSTFLSFSAKLNN